MNKTIVRPFSWEEKVTYAKDRFSEGASFRTVRNELEHLTDGYIGLREMRDIANQAGFKWSNKAIMIAQRLM